MGLKWSDIDWLNGTVLVQRGVVANRTDAVKTKYSTKQLPLDAALVSLPQDWGQMLEFNKDNNWVWASPWVAGEMPYYPNAIQFNYIRPAGKQAGLADNIHVPGVARRNQGTNDGAEGSHASRQHLYDHECLGWTTPEPMREANSAVVRMIIQ